MAAFDCHARFLNHQRSLFRRFAADERGNDDALAGLVIHKRHGVGDPLDQWVTCTVRELIAILRGSRIPEDPTPDHELADRFTREDHA